MNDNWLAHHGILGMKWGVRRTPEQLGHVKEKLSEAKNRFVRSSGSRNSSVLKEARGKDINKLTNKELQDYNQRLNLEQQFANLTKGRIGNAKDWIVKTVISGIVVGTISGATKSLGQDWVKEKIKTHLKDNPLELRRILDPASNVVRKFAEGFR